MKLDCFKKLMEFWGINFECTLRKIADELNDEAEYYSHFPQPHDKLTAIVNRLIYKKIFDSETYKYKKLNIGGE